MKIERSNNKGFTLVEIMIVVALIGMLATIVVPNAVSARTSTRKNVCINNLRLLEHAKEQWALDMNKGSGEAPASVDVEGYMRGGTLVRTICPAGGIAFADSYDLMTVGTNSECIIDPTVPQSHRLA